jgi:ABC-type sugar transport system permease subunit
VTLYDFIIFFRQGDYGYGSAISWLTLLFIASATTTYFYLLTRKRA